MWITQTISQTVNLCYTHIHTQTHTLAVTHTWAEFFSTALRTFLWLAMGASSLALSSLLLPPPPPPLLPRSAATLTPCLPQQLCLLVFVCVHVCVCGVFISHFLCTFSTVITSFYIIFHTPEEEEGTHQTTRRRSRPRCRRAAPPAHF